MKKIYSSDNYIQAELIKGRFESEGINCNIYYKGKLITEVPFSSLASPIYSAKDGYDLMIAEEDEEAAEVIVKEIDQ